MVVELVKTPIGSSKVTRSSQIYRAVARVLSRAVFNDTSIHSVCVRRSVASGEAVFPFSDIDFDITIASDSGLLIERLRQRYYLARILFPRIGQCFVMTPSDPDELSVTEPYRASINRRCFFHARGIAPAWPENPISTQEAARRVVFWLEEYFPAAVRTGHRRNQRKFYLEMCNALGLIEGKWDEPRISSNEIEKVYSMPPGSLFECGLEIAARTHALLGRRAPKIDRTFHFPGLTILPTSRTVWPSRALSDSGMVVTPESLDLLLQTQRPGLWLEHGKALSALGFELPSRHAWVRSARRLAGVLWLRGPGFFERRNGQQERRLRLARHILESIETGTNPPPPLPTQVSPRAGGVRSYYLHVYDGLATEARLLRNRARLLE
jgi:hypothetical protein